MGILRTGVDGDDSIGHLLEIGLVDLPVSAHRVHLDVCQLRARSPGHIRHAVGLRPHVGRGDLLGGEPGRIVGQDADAKLQAADWDAIRIDHANLERPGRHERKLRPFLRSPFVQISHAPHPELTVPGDQLLKSLGSRKPQSELAICSGDAPDLKCMSRGHDLCMFGRTCLCQDEDLVLDRRRQFQLNRCCRSRDRTHGHRRDDQGCLMIRVGRARMQLGTVTEHAPKLKSAAAIRAGDHERID